LAAVSLLVYKLQGQAFGFGRWVLTVGGLGGKRSHAVRLIALLISSELSFLNFGK
jgi:hypothetical protein